MIGLVVGIVGTLGGVLVTQISAAPPVDDRLTLASERCGTGAGVSLEDDGHTLVFDMMGDDEFSGASYSDFECIAGALKMPSRVSNHVGQTTSLDGRQVEDWDGIEFSWSYHPDRGLDGVFVLLDAEQTN